MDGIAGGIYTALVTPFDKNGEIDFEVLKKLVRLNRANGVNRFYVCGSAAEMTLLSVKERKDLLRTVLSERPDFCIAHVGGQNFRDSMELAADAADAGAGAVSSVVPLYFRYSIDELAYYYRSIGEASGLPVVLYNIPSLSGVDLGERELIKLMSLECIKGIKFTSRDLYLLERIKTAFPEKKVLNGCDEVLYPGLAAGADGAVGATYNIMPDKAARLYQAWKNGDTAICRKMQSELNDVISVMLPLVGRKSVKTALRLLGFGVGESREPFLPQSEEQSEIIRTKVLPLLTLKLAEL